MTMYTISCIESELMLTFFFSSLVQCSYLSSLILVEGMDVDFLHKCALEDCTEQHQFSSVPDIVKV